MAQEIKQGSLQVLDLRLSLGLLVPFCMTWLKPCHFLVPVFSHPVIFYFCCLFILKTSCFRDRYTFCTVFNKLGPKSLNSSEVPAFSCNADNVYLYTSDYRGEDHTIIFFLQMFYLPLYFHPFLIPVFSKFLSSFAICWWGHQPNSAVTIVMLLWNCVL